jgi:hypothetical protein
MWIPGSSPPLALGSHTPSERLPEKPCDAYAWSISIISSELLWDFSHLPEGEDARGLPG